MNNLWHAGFTRRDILRASIAVGAVGIAGAGRLGSASALEKLATIPRGQPSTTASPAIQPAALLSAPGVLFGGWQPSAPGAAWALDSFETALGHRPGIIHWYQGWGAGNRALDLGLLTAATERGALPMITWEPWDYTQGLDQPNFSLKRIRRGAFDAYIRTWATGLKAYGGPVLLRFAHEMNGRSYPWSVNVNGNSTADYILAWRRVVGIFRRAGADNVAFVWCPNVPSDWSPPLAACFPGDDYVDVVAMDGYNAGTSAAWGGWLSFESVFGSTYDTVANLSSKPIIIAETGCSEEGGDKAGWVNDMFSGWQSRFPRLAGIVWFNEAREADWRVESSFASSSAFRNALANPAYGVKSPPLS